MRLRTLAIWGTAIWVLAVIGLFYFLLWLQTRRPYSLVGFLDDTTGEQPFDEARTSATLLGVSGLAGAALIVYRRQRCTEETLDNERVRAMRERYSAAAEQLGNDNAAIPLAGVYGLSSLTDDWQTTNRHSESQVCIDLLAPTSAQTTCTRGDPEVPEAIPTTVHRGCGRPARGFAAGSVRGSTYR